MGHIWYYSRKIMCALGIHWWATNSGVDRYFYPDTKEKCFICGKRR
jgi:hypothetical protein